MIAPLPIPDELWATVPPDAQAAIAAVLRAMQQRIDELETRVGDLEARLKLNSTNSSKPPSSDPIGMKRKPPAPPGGKKRGGRPGHRKAQRTLVPPEKVRETFDRKPTVCRRCGHGLSGDDPEPLIHQVAELPEIEPFVDEYRLHRLTCPACRETTCGALPAGVPTGCFGPYLQAVLAMFAGVYRLDKRQIRQVAADLFTLSISTGMISKLERQSAAVLEAPCHELAIAVHQARVANIDETSWRECFRKVWLWATVTPLFTVFTIAKSRSGEVAQTLLGSEDDQIVGSDRFSAYAWIMARWRRICWAHLRRDFQAMIDRGSDGETIDRPTVAVVVEPVVPPLASGTRRDSPVEFVPNGDESLACGSQGSPGGRGAVPVREDSGHVLRDPRGGGGFVGVRASPRGRADEQRGGTCVASCGDLASDQRRDRQRGREPVCGTHAERRGNLPSTEA